MLHKVFTAAMAAVVSTGLAGPLAGQVREVSLDRTDAVFPESFSSINGLRELPDGRVMVADGLGQALVIVNLQTGRADTLGRTGGGPGEYKSPDGLFPLPADSTLLVDLGNGRMVAVAPDGSFGETMPLTSGDRSSGMMITIPRGTDAQGAIYFQAMGGMRPGGLPDSAAVIRMNRSTGALDTLTMVKLEDRSATTSGGTNNRNVMVRALPMSPRDGWAVGPDGQVVAVRSDAYRVEIVRSNGQTVRGPTVEYRPVRVGRAEKEAWLEDLGSSGLSVAMTVENGVRRTSFSRGASGRTRGEIDDYEWPDVMPAFRASEVYVTPEGSTWVQRYTRAEDAPVFDVFDAQGALTQRVTLPKGRRIVGFGRGTVYLAAADEFDLQYLERYSRVT